MKTLYTRGEGLISQERNGEKSYYLYDGFDSVRMLADEDNNITDTYTFDAFGNLVSSTGDTENSYLYRGEQYDSFTGLYYLRARYMNPTTGTFISMDEYAGSVFEPVSLHKYLYANSNPVMYTDPSGYLSLGELGASMAIQGVLGGMVSAAVNWLTFYYTAAPNQAFNWGEFWNSVFMGAVFGAGFGAVGTYAYAVRSVAIMTALGFSSLAFAGVSYAQANVYKELGEDELAFMYSLFTVLNLWGAARSFQQAYTFSTAKTTAATTTNNSNNNTCTADSCFIGETLVATENGQRRIDKIQVGDKVWAYNVETGETELKTVTKVYVHDVDEILHLSTTEGVIDTTTNHPFYVLGKGWVAAGDLVSGDEVYNLDSTTAIVLGSWFEKLDTPILVYNLEVEDFHSYFVGNASVLVHNRCGTEPGRNEKGEYTNGNYKMSSKGNSDHNSGSTRPRNDEAKPPSQFLNDVDDVKATFDAASYADANDLWVDNKATVYVTNGPVGITGSGDLTSYITVTRTDTGYIHGWPANPK